jgi:NTP pyrophosphatase (non-canonical NTP hydrolase)
MQHVGDLAKHIDVKDKSEWYKLAEKFYENLLQVGDSLRIDVIQAVHAKMLLNENKYPIDLCQGSVEKYTAYSKATNITKQVGQDIDDCGAVDRRLVKERNDCNHFFVIMDRLTDKAFKFLNDRNIGKYDTPKNLLFALFVELGELCELFQWKDEEQVLVLISEKEWNNAANEIADVIIYSLKLHSKILDGFLQTF